MRVTIHREADAELRAAAQWYEDQREGLGEKFLNELLDTFEAIEQHPTRYPQHMRSSAHDVRRKMPKSFPYSVVYELQEKRLLVAAVMHSSRKPRYWLDRLS
jgi:plasmid stabilization system protein ParE